MSRLDMLSGKKPAYTSYDNGISSVVTDFNKKDKKVLVIDFDSIAFAKCIPKVEERRGAYLEEDVEIYIIPGIREKLFEIEQEVSQYFEIVETYCFIDGKDSYRKKIFPLYKSNRINPPAVLPLVYQKCIELLNVKRADDGMEADDSIYKLGKQFKDFAILAYIDKDIKQIPGINYNYNKKTWQIISEEEAKFNLAIQICTGDPGDFVKVNKGCGEAKAVKFVSKGMTDYQYLKGIIQCYKAYNPTLTDVKPLIRQTYKLLSLGTKYEE